MIMAGYYMTEAEIEGWNLLVPMSYLDHNMQGEIEKHTGGCGPGRLGDWFVPDTMWGESIFLACRIHDWMYHTGTTLEDKRVADKVFLWNMVVLIDDGEFLDNARLRRVMTYYQAVSFGGNDCFNNGGENGK